MVWRDTRVKRAELGYWRTSIGEEVDFVIEASGKLLPIEMGDGAGRCADAAILGRGIRVLSALAESAPSNHPTRSRLTGRRYGRSFPVTVLRGRESLVQLRAGMISTAVTWICWSSRRPRRPCSRWRHCRSKPSDCWAFRWMC